VSKRQIDHRLAAGIDGVLDVLRSLVERGIAIAGGAVGGLSSFGIGCRESVCQPLHPDHVVQSLCVWKRPDDQFPDLFLIGGESGHSCLLLYGRIIGETIPTSEPLRHLS
jgi:hypothetical protein